LEKKVETNIISEKLFSKNDNILVAISGGCDSVALTHILKKLNFNISLAHCNFKLRGKDSDKDELFVKNLAEKLKLPLFIKNFDTTKFAKNNNYSIEEAARILRYDWFEEIRTKQSLDYIAVAHHLDDKIETFFINIIAGTGIRGIRSIKAKNNKVVRPLLFAKRNDIESWCLTNKINYRTDNSNFETKFIRNKIRHNILPVFNEINPSFSDTMFKNFKTFSDFELIYNQYVSNAEKKILKKRNNFIYLNIEQLLNEVAPITALFELLSPYGFNSTQITDIVDNLDTMQSGKEFTSSDYRLIKDRTSLIIKKKSSLKHKEYLINENQKNIKSPLPLQIDIQEYTETFKLLKSNNIAYFDAGKIKFPLIIRKKIEGDYFYPFGMKGKKLLSDFFTDIKLNRFEKEDTFLLLSGKDIIWIIGYRTDEKYKITDKTKQVLVIKYR